MKKKMLGVLLTGIMAMAVLGGCGKKEAETEAATEAAEAATEADVEAQTEEKTTTAEEGKLVVGFDAEYPPYGYMDDNGEYTGFDLELAQAVCDIEGWELVKTPIDWDSKDMELNSGSIDCIWNGFTINGREEDYTFSDPYLDNRQVFVVNSDSDIQSSADLAGKIVEVQADSSAEAALNDNTELSGTFGTMQTVPDYNTAMMDLEQGAVDAIAMDEVVAAYQIQNRENQFRILDEEISSEEYAIGFLKGNEKLRDNVQQVLQEMAEDGTIAEISTEWFGSDITTFAK